MSASIASVKLQGNLTVGFRQIAGLWHANALQFDIVGTGRSKDAAFRQLQELVTEYLMGVIAEIKKGNKVAFFNPADSEEWNAARYREEFEVHFEVALPKAAAGALPPKPPSIQKIKGRVRSVELIPA